MGSARSLRLGAIPDVPVHRTLVRGWLEPYSRSSTLPRALMGKVPSMGMSM